MDLPCPAFPHIFWVELGVGPVRCVTRIYRGLSGCSAGGGLLADLGNLICLLQSLPPKLPVICQTL